jgi:hypothetical protein
LCHKSVTGLSPSPSRLQPTSVFDSVPHAEPVEAGSAERYGRRRVLVARPFQQGPGGLLTHASLRRPCFDRLSMRYRVENKEETVKAPLSSAERHEPKGCFTTCLLVHDTVVVLSLSKDIRRTVRIQANLYYSSGLIRRNGARSYTHRSAECPSTGSGRGDALKADAHERVGDRSIG